MTRSTIWKTLAENLSLLDSIYHSAKSHIKGCQFQLTALYNQLFNCSPDAEDLPFWSNDRFGCENRVDMLFFGWFIFNPKASISLISTNVNIIFVDFRDLFDFREWRNYG